MAELLEDDLFRQSSMSFGEHLDELRRRLFRAAFWLIGGVIIGFFVSEPVAHALQDPMERALREYKQKTTQKNLPASDAEQQLATQGWIGDRVYVQPSAIEGSLKNSFPDLQLPKTPLKSKTVPGKNATAPDKNATAADKNATAADKDAEAAGLVPLTIWRPGSTDPSTQLNSFGAVEPFVIYLKTALLTGIILASPMIFRELWLFIAAGLYPHERRYVHVFLPLSIGLFLAGVLMGFFVAFPKVLTFLLSFNVYLGINPMPRIEDYWSFVLFLPLAFGIGFQLPLVMLFINRIGLVTTEAYLKQWRLAVLAIWIIAMVMMPSPDVLSMTLLALPMTLLYFLGIALCKYTSGRRPAGLGGE
jgi:sec-independent protein translocase protein TatC